MKTKQAAARTVAFGYDLGGTALKFGLVFADGAIVTRSTLRLDRERGLASVREVLGAAGRRMREDAAARGIEPVCAGIGVAGTVIGAAGRLVTPSPSMPYMRGFSIAAFVERTAGLPAVAENDATIAAFGEFRLGVGRGRSSLLMATVGTGLGGGLVVDGRLIRGKYGTAGEIGHGVFQPDGLACGCGSRGCLEQYTASRALMRYHRDAGGSPGTRVSAILTDALAGRRAARRAVLAIGRNLGIGIATHTSLVPVDVVAIGGGISVLGRLLLDPVRAAFEAHALPYVRKSVRIVKARLGNDAGIAGAALLAFDAADSD